MKHINHVGVSGGKDSTALLLWAVHESGYPLDTLRATFCDTGNEAEETYAFVRMLSETVFPIEWIKPPLDFYELAKQRNRFPSAKARFCTQELKMKPTAEWINARLAEGYTVLNHSGVRAAESADRAKLEDREPAWVSYFGVETFRPLLRWSIDDVWAIHARYGIEPNPLYKKGCKRVGCLPCIMSRKEEVMNIALHMPERIDRIDVAESETGHIQENGERMSTFFARNMVPIRWRTKIVTTRANRTTKVQPEAPDVAPRLPGMDVERKGVLRAKGFKMAVASVRDVARWAVAGRARNIAIDFDDLEEPPTCDSRSGLCE